MSFSAHRSQAEPLRVREMAYVCVFKAMKIIVRFPTEDISSVLFKQGSAFRNSEEELTLPFGTAFLKRCTIIPCQFPSPPYFCIARAWWKDVWAQGGDRASNPSFVYALFIIRCSLSPPDTHTRMGHASPLKPQHDLSMISYGYITVG